MAGERISVLAKENASLRSPGFDGSEVDAVGQQKYEQVCSERDSLRISLRKSRSDLDEAQETIVSVTAEKSALSQQVARLEARMETLQRDGVSENRTLESPSSRNIKVLDRRTLEDMARESEAKILTYEEKMFNYESDIAELEKENKTLTQKMLNFKKVAEKNFNTVGEAKTLLRRYKDERKKQLDMNATLRNSLKETMLQLKESETNVARLREALQSKGNNAGMLMQQNVETITKENETFKVSLLKAKEHIERLVSKNESMEAELEEANAEVEELRAQQGATEDAEELRERVAELEEDLDVVLEELEEARASVDPLEEAMEEKDAEIRLLHDKLDELMLKKSPGGGRGDRKLAAENARLREELAELEENAAQLTKDRKAAVSAKQMYEGFWKDAKDQMMKMERTMRRG